MSSRTQAILIGGTFSGVLSALPYVSAANICCCLWLTSGGVVTAYVMQQGQPQPLEFGDAAVSGALAGLVGAVVYVVVSLPIQYLLLPLQPDPSDILGATGDLPPEAVALIERMLTSPFLAVMAGFAIMVVVAPIFSSLGALLGTLFFRKKLPAPTPTPSDIVPPPPGL